MDCRSAAGAAGRSATGPSIATPALGGVRDVGMSVVVTELGGQRAVGHDLLHHKADVSAALPAVTRSDRLLGAGMLRERQPRCARGGSVPVEASCLCRCGAGHG